MEKFTVTFLYGASDKGRLQNFSREVSAENYEISPAGHLNFLSNVGVVATFAAGEWKWVEKQTSVLIPAFGNA